MSFSNSNNKGDTRQPGRITPVNVMQGLCERIVIETVHIFDESIKQEHFPDHKVEIEHVEPYSPACPLIFEKATTASNTGILQNLQVTRLPKNENFSRVTADCIVAMELVFIDANDKVGKGFFTLHAPIDIILLVPECGHVPVTFSAQVNAICPKGKFIEDNTFFVDACINLVIKCGAVEDIVIPTYGNALIHPSIDYNVRVCEGFFEKPMFPHC